MNRIFLATTIIVACSGCASLDRQLSSARARLELLSASSASSLLKQHPTVEAYVRSHESEPLSTYQSQLSDAETSNPALKVDVDQLQAALEKKLHKTVNYCNGILVGDEKKVDTGRNWALAIEVVGALAGAVAVPALAAKHAAASLIALSGGVAGTANTLQNSVKAVGYDAESQYAAREELRKILVADAHDFQTGLANFPQNAVSEAGILDHMWAECAFAPISAPTASPPTISVGK
ncbi:hypothetical protein [Trinickia symbiotica]|uniref:hypothetical protein n=1 Tax=Trinickia symbiotica TaxID=863227 RepID=UPI0011B291EA|nr:hypothetical protein [Trinickia symbiotica]